MATRTPLHRILAEEAKARTYRRCGTGWAKDYGEIVAEIKLRSQSVKGWFCCQICLYIKLDHVPTEYLELLEEFTPRMVHIYMPPAISPDKKSHLLKVVNETMIGPSTDQDRALSVRVSRAFELDRNGNFGEGQAEEARRFMVKWGFEPLDICRTQAELIQRLRRAEPPFGEFMQYAKKYLR